MITQTEPLNTLRLHRNVQFLYEEHLARVELNALGCDLLHRDDDDAWRIRAHVNGNSAIVRARSAYVGNVDGEPTTYEKLIKPAYQGGKFNRTRSVNQYLTHWIYPYRGKFHPQMVRSLLNIIGIQPGDLVLEPFLGSGTTALEAILLGANCVGVDRSPVCVLVAKVKTQAWTAVDMIRERVAELLADPRLRPEDVHPSREADQRVSDFLQVAKLVTASDVSRRDRDADKWLRKNLERMLESVTDQAEAVREFGLSPGEAELKIGDTRDLAAAGVKPESIDGAVTSPPYSLALDYVANDEHALLALDENLPRLREAMIGVRGDSSAEKMAAYEEDMKRSFVEMARVLKPGAAAAYVVGDATVGGTEVKTTGEMVEWAEAAGLRLERNIPKIVFGLYNVMNDEKILVFRKG